MPLHPLGSSRSRRLGKSSLRCISSIIVRAESLSLPGTHSIKTLPHIINAVILTSAWSAGNTYVFTSSRTLYGLALQGQAPKFFTRLNKQGVPWTCVCAVWLVSLLSFLSEFCSSRRMPLSQSLELMIVFHSRCWKWWCRCCLRMAPELDRLGRLERLGDHRLCICSNDSGFQSARHFERQFAHARSLFALVPILFVRLLRDHYRV